MTAELNKVEVDGMTVGEVIGHANSRLEHAWAKMMWPAQTDDPYSNEAAAAARRLIRAGTIDLKGRAVIEPYLAMSIGTVSLNSIYDVRTGGVRDLSLNEHLNDARVMLRAALDTIEDNMAMNAQADWFGGRATDRAEFETLMRMCDQIEHVLDTTEGMTFPPIEEEDAE